MNEQIITNLDSDESLKELLKNIDTIPSNINIFNDIVDKILNVATTV